MISYDHHDSTTITCMFVKFLLGEQLSSAPCTCSSEVGIAVGALLLVEGIIAGVITIIVVSCWIVMRYYVKTMCVTFSQTLIQSTT